MGTDAIGCLALGQGVFTATVRRGG